jgi:hypothetical protein
MFELTDEQIDKAAMWWSNIITNPKFDGLSKEERKDSAEVFAEALKDELRNKEYNPYWGLSVDYHPCSELADAAKKAGVSGNNFPWKTSMWFKEDGSVSVAYGYQQPAVEL